MKQFLLISLLVFSMSGFAQPGNFPVKGQRAGVTDWGSLALIILGSDYFAGTRDSLVYQMGEAEFETMKTRCSANGWPDGFYGGGQADDDGPADKKRSQLVMYKIAAVNHIYNGKTFERYAVLRVPYAENKNWAPGVAWEGSLYLMVNESAVTLLK